MSHQPDAHDLNQSDPTLAVREGRPVGLVGVIVLDTDARSGHRRTRHPSIVDDQSRHVGGEHRLHQLHQANGQIGDRDVRPFDQLVLGSPVRLSPDRTNGAGDPAFQVEQATDQEFGEGATGARCHSHQEKENPFRDQQANRRS